MEEKNKVYVFAKKEVFTIFFIMILSTFISFLLGVKMGGSFVMKDVGITPHMTNKLKMKAKDPLEFKSVEEETVEDMQMKKDEMPAAEEKDAYREEIRKKIEEEFSNEDKKFNNSMPDTTMTKPSENKMEETKQEVAQQESVQVKKSKWSGKRTIQLLATKDKAEAEAFARTVTVRGYDPIIYDVDIPGRGKWYRVSVGVFESVTEAKDYILKNKSFFQGSDPHFAKFE